MLQSIALVLALATGIFAWGKLRDELAKLDAEDRRKPPKKTAGKKTGEKRQKSDEIETLEMDETTGIYRKRDD